MKKIKKKGLLVLVLVLSSMLILNGCKVVNSREVSLESDLFKTMETVDLEGEKVDSSIFSKSKLTVVNAWNIGCTPCVEELPILDQLNDEYAENEVSILGLYLGMSEEDREEVENVLSDGNIKYQQLLTSENMLQTETLKNITAFPTTYFVNDKGEIIDFIEGSNDYDGWKALIEEKLKEVN